MDKNPAHQGQRWLHGVLGVSWADPPSATAHLADTAEASQIGVLRMSFATVQTPSLQGALMDTSDTS
jgi:hypothetical protein